MFADPKMFDLLVPVFLFAVALYLAAKVRRRRTYRFLQKNLLPEVAGTASSRRRIVRDGLLLMVLITSVVALARPRWGVEWREVHSQGVDIFIAIDTSRSMLTRDVAPTRLERAKIAVRDLLKRLKGDRVGVIVFAGDAFLMCPLTSDYGAVALSLEGVDSRAVPRGGTDIGLAIAEALKGYSDVPARFKAVVILTDGESLEGDPLAQAALASKQGVRVHAIGIGTREGEIIQVPDETGGLLMLKDAEGNAVKSRLNETLLKEIAAAGGGVYVRSSGAELGLDYIYERYLSRLEKRTIESRVEKVLNEQYQWPLSLALLLLLAETFFPERRRAS